jgi:hypothetical protein
LLLLLLLLPEGCILPQNFLHATQEMRKSTHVSIQPVRENISCPDSPSYLESYEHWMVGSKLVNIQSKQRPEQACLDCAVIEAIPLVPGHIYGALHNAVGVLVRVRQQQLDSL